MTIEELRDMCLYKWYRYKYVTEPNVRWYIKLNYMNKDYLYPVDSLSLRGAQLCLPHGDSSFQDYSVHRNKYLGTLLLDSLLNADEQLNKFGIERVEDEDYACLLDLLLL